ncbi:MAG: glycoside hydrolase family 2 protein, partial [Oscillospiraceae bacterium]|nr:glycoside hydrolase family 2 protein [Oscillospiraceae bacterium]
MKKINFNDNWTFYNRKGIPKTVNLPHDAMLEEKRDPNSPGGSAVGFFPPGEYIYEKTFIAPEDWIGKFIAIQFEGIYKDSRISINGNEAGGCRYGYIPFSIEATCFLKYGQENTIRVEVDNKDMPNSRWYTGAGIYRPVWMWVGEKKHIKIDGIKISTLSYNPARIYIEIDSTGGEAYVDIAYKGKKTASASGNKIEIEIPDAKLWSAETPELYECHVTLKDETGIVDEARENFGIRKVEWSNKGLFINGKETLLRGGCIHHDNGILGA